MPSSLVLSPSTKAPSANTSCLEETVNAFIPAKSVTSESIKAPKPSTSEEDMFSLEKEIAALSEMSSSRMVWFKILFVVIELSITEIALSAT